MTYTISQGNDRKMFGINSTSGELLLVTPLTVTANDKIVLVVSVFDVLSTNSSFQDTAVVKMTFRGKQNYCLMNDWIFSVKSLKVLMYIIRRI